MADGNIVFSLEGYMDGALLGLKVVNGKTVGEVEGRDEDINVGDAVGVSVWCFEGVGCAVCGNGDGSHKSGLSGDELLQIVGFNQE